MQTLLQLAAVDASHQRPQDAMQKYAVCYEYYLTQGQPVQQSMCLEGVGDVMAKNQQVDVAKGRYQQALALSSKAGPEGLPLVALVNHLPFGNGGLCKVAARPGCLTPSVRRAPG